MTHKNAITEARERLQIAYIKEDHAPTLKKHKEVMDKLDALVEAYDKAASETQATRKALKAQQEPEWT